MLRILSVTLSSAVILSGSLSASDGPADWPQFRGPGSRGHSGSPHLPLTWSESSHVTWKSALPGEGHSSPVIADGRIWLTTAVTRPLDAAEESQRLSEVRNPRNLQVVGQLSLLALEVDQETGQIERQISLFEVSDPEPKHSLNSYASPTPVIAGAQVYFHFGTYGTACVLRETGEVVWRNDDIRIYHQNGPGSSPAVWNDKLIVHFDGTDEQSIVAFDRFSGEVAWQTRRSGEMNPTPEMKKAYATPLIVDGPDGPLVISPAADWVYGYDARNGNEVWRAAYGQLGFSTVPCPVVAGDTAYIATSFMQSRLLAVRFTGRGDVTETHIRWTSDKQIPKKPSLLLSGSRLYFVSDNGIVRCVDADTGEDIWYERLPGEYSASPLLAAGRLYFFSQSGVTTVLEDSGSYHELAVNRLDDGFMASPAVADDALFLRTTQHLYRIERTTDDSSN